MGGIIVLIFTFIETGPRSSPHYQKLLVDVVLATTPVSCSSGPTESLCILLT